MKNATYQLMEDAEFWWLTGGRLEEPLRYPLGDETIQTVKQLVGFLSQYIEAELRIFRAGETVPCETKTYPQRGLPPSRNMIGAL